jgi:hypothetical protein
MSRNLANGQNAADDWSGPPFEIQKSIPKTDTHVISLELAKDFANEWNQFKKEFDSLMEFTSNPLLKYNSKQLLNRINSLRKYMLINYETFFLDDQDKFKERLNLMMNKSDALQIAFGMKPVNKEFETNFPEIFGGKEFMSCVVLIGRTKDGEVVPEEDYRL